MNPRKLISVLVCLVIFGMIYPGVVAAWNLRPAAYSDSREDLYAPPTTAGTATEGKPIYKVVPKRITKVKPQAGLVPLRPPYGIMPICLLPNSGPGGWEMEAEAFFGRIRGQVRFQRGPTLFAALNAEEVDFNSTLGLPQRSVIPSFGARYQMRPGWTLRYSIMPTSVEATTNPTQSFSFGTNNHGLGQTIKSKWERIYQRMGLSFDPVRTPSTRVSVFGEYVRINERLSVYQAGCCGDNLDNDLNMGMAGLEIERCLKTTRHCNTLSLECRGGMAWGDDATGYDLAAGLRYSVPLNNGRWGYIKGGYRLVSFKRKSSDFKMMETDMEGGFLQMGFIF